MNLDDILKQYDPARESGDADLAAMRESILNAKPRSPRRIGRAIVACALLLLLAGVLVYRRRDVVPQRPAPVVRNTPLRQRPETRQLQLTTPGGTQLIWVFNDSM